MFAPNDPAVTGTVSRSLLEVLYTAYLRTQPDADQTLTDFIAFGQRYMADNRPVELFHLDLNYGLRLANNELCLVAPSVSSQPFSDMQPNTAIKI
jgi:hypothetical protein